MILGWLHTSLRGETSEVFWNSFLVLTGNSLGGCRSWSCRKWKKGQRRLFFILFFSFLLLLQSCLSFPSFDSFLPFSEKTTLSDANALHVGGFLSLSQIAVVVVDVSMDWKEVERICRPLFCPSIFARLYLLLLGYNRDSLKHHIAPCVNAYVAGSWLISERVHIEKRLLLSPPLELGSKKMRSPYIGCRIFRCVRLPYTLCWYLD